MMGALKQICTRCEGRIARRAWSPPSLPPPKVTTSIRQNEQKERIACALCFDLLSTEEQALILDSIRKATRFDPTEWQHIRQIRRLTIALPLALDTLRHHLTVTTLANRDRKVPTVKDWLRRDLAHQLVEAHHVDYNEGASASTAEYGVTIDLQVQQAFAETEMDRLMALPEAGLSLVTVRLPGKQRSKKVKTLPGRQIILDALQSRVDAALLEQTFPLALPSPAAAPSSSSSSSQSLDLRYSATVAADTIYLGGRYCKYRRSISQTPFFGGPGGTLRCDESVSAFIEKEATPFAGAEGFNMHASGREDMDVRMLGDGRPFYLAFVNPSRLVWSPDDLTELMRRVNASAAEPIDVETPAQQGLDLPLKAEGDREAASRQKMAIKDLQRVTMESIQKIKEGEAEKQKVYTCLIEAPLPTSSGGWLKAVQDALPLTVTLEQRTPQRVEYRRADLVRRRTVELTRLVPGVGSSQCILSLSAEAGTYIKEFVHGDKERTSPSLSDVLLPIILQQDNGQNDKMQQTFDIKRLDVNNVILPWPTKEDLYPMEDK